MAAGARDTRSNPNPKYSLGEKVLCYEPDPTKARVMYEAKVRILVGFVSLVHQQNLSFGRQ